MSGQPLPLADIRVMGAAQAAAVASGVGLQVLAARLLPPREYACFASANLVGMVAVLALVGR